MGMISQENDVSLISGKMADTGDTIQAVASFLGVKCGKITYEGNERVHLQT